LPFVLVLCGYAFILLIDKVIIDAHSHSGGHGHVHEPKHKKNVSNSEPKINEPLVDEDKVSQIFNI
jgi:hypothetical protein